MKHQNKRGEVGIMVRGDRLSLRWSFNGERKYLSLGLEDTKLNRAIMQQIASEIETDIKNDRYDRTLDKYRRKTTAARGITINDFFAEYWKTRVYSAHRTYQGFAAPVNHLSNFIGDQDINTITSDQAWEFSRFLPVPLDTRRIYLYKLNKMWDWGITNELIKTPNHWLAIARSIPKKKYNPEPLTEEETRKILEAAEGNHYYPFIKFLFLTGCRIGEAAALKWEDIRSDFSQIFFYSPKTNETRYITCTPELIELLKSTQPFEVDPGDPVFKSDRNSAIIVANFRRRNWKQILIKAGVPYKRPYITRSTMIHNSLEKGVPPVHLSRIVGNSVQVLIQHYMGRQSNNTQLPSWLDE